MLLLCIILSALSGRCGGLFDPAKQIEAARIYGNIDQYAYYYVDLLIGSPPQRVSVILDTGSGLAAFPCASCTHCGRHIDPNFDFSRSSSAQWIGCGNECGGGSCKANHCSYYQGYTEGSSISGYWFQDNVRLGDLIQENPGVTARMGCHQNENNLFFTQKANGIFGVGPPRVQGGNSILQALFADQTHVETKIFSICLAEWGGRLVVGGYNASYHTGTVDYVPLNVASGYYNVGLTGLQVDGNTIDERFGRTMIDSGTTYTYMASKPYKRLKSEIESFCTRNNGCGAKKSGTTCWAAPDGLSGFPDVKVIFGSTSTTWKPKSYLYRKVSSGNWCYGFMDDGANANTVLGATWMVHQEVVFDMRDNRVGIVQANCPEFKQRPAAPGVSVEPTANAVAASTIATTTTATTVASAVAAAFAAVVTTTAAPAAPKATPRPTASAAAAPPKQVEPEDAAIAVRAVVGGEAAPEEAAEASTTAAPQAKTKAKPKEAAPTDDAAKAAPEEVAASEEAVPTQEPAKAAPKAAAASTTKEPAKAAPKAAAASKETLSKLWPQYGADRRKCGGTIVAAAAALDCQQIAVDKGHSYFSFSSAPVRCSTSDSCDSPIGTNFPWKIYQQATKSQLKDLPASPMPQPNSTDQQPISRLTPRPTLRPTPRPTLRPTLRPTPRATLRLTPRPTLRPTPRPTWQPTSRPTPRPTPRATLRPTSRPTPRPTSRPTPRPTTRPTLRPTPPPTARPSPRPTPRPTRRPTPRPTLRPTPRPTFPPTPPPTYRPKPPRRTWTSTTTESPEEIFAANSQSWSEPVEEREEPEEPSPTPAPPTLAAGGFGTSDGVIVLAGIELGTTRLVLGAASALLVIMLVVCLVWFKKGRKKKRHRHFNKLKELEESGMPPQIVGSIDGVSSSPYAPGPETFEIGDDEDADEFWEEKFLKEEEVPNDALTAASATSVVTPAMVERNDSADPGSNDMAGLLSWPAASPLPPSPRLAPLPPVAGSSEDMGLFWPSAAPLPPAPVLAPLPPAVAARQAPVFGGKGNQQNEFEGGLLD